MDVWGIPVLASVDDILQVIRLELKTQNIDLLKDIKPTNNNIMVTCINHGGGVENKPALGITTVDVFRDNKLHPAGTCHCYVCGYISDFPTFISNCFGYDDGGQFGFKWLTTHFVNLSVEQREPLKLDMSRGHKNDVQGPQLVTEAELASYRYNHPYMKKRGLTDRVIDYFDVGYDEKTDCLTFPVRDLNGDVPFVQRRAVKGKFFKNAEDSLRGSVIYGLYEVYKNLSWIKEVYVGESITDALTLWNERKAGLATLGAIPTQAQIKLLRDLPVRKIISAYDNDKAGEEGTARLKKYLGQTKVLYRVKFPKNVKDINEMYVKHREQFDNMRTILL